MKCIKCDVELDNYEIEHNKGLCTVCDQKLNEELEFKKLEFLGIPEIEQGMQLMLEGLHRQFGLDLNDPNFVDTPKRVARAWVEIFSGVKDTKGQIDKILKSHFPSTNDSKYALLLFLYCIYCFPSISLIRVVSP